MEPLPVDFLAVDWNGTIVPTFQLPAYPDAARVLQAWRDQGLTVAIVSCAPQAMIDADVRRTGIVVDEVIGCQDKAPVFAELRSRYGRGVVLGDIPADLRAAREAGLPFIQAQLEDQQAIEGREASFRMWGEVDLLLGRALA